MVPLIPVVMTHVRLPPKVKPTCYSKPRVKLKHNVQLESQHVLQLRKDPADVWTKRARASWNLMSVLFSWFPLTKQEGVSERMSRSCVFLVLS